ncbi:MAG: hypothetical protein KF749_17585 [Bacteroidetes bacterium]|nr:hypothetical protein [Bacteroidota bacterium]MCW5894139.1 hypothetical protein [Bacteroidota bacterium]
MSPSIITGWLFDIYPSSEGIRLWLIDKEGVKHQAFVPFVPSFFMHVSREQEQRVAALVRSLPFNITLDRVTRKELYSNEEWNVLRINVHDTLRFKQVVQRLERHFPHYVFFNSDIQTQQIYLYETGLFPLALGDYCINENGMLTEWHLQDTYDASVYTMPPLTTMKLMNRPDFVSPKFRKSYQIEISYDGETYSLENDQPAEILHAVNHHLKRCDPDIILTEYGDAILLPLLVKLSDELKIPLLLNRDKRAGYFTTRESSYFVYGKMVHKDGAFELAGRWHLDIENSFMMGEASLDGVVEIARLTQLPVQHQSRSTIGTALSSMQLSWAYRNNYLIPAKKREPEEFKSAATLLLADRGGLIFQPVMGYHEQIGELDFVSMYPTIMVQHNVSPETVNCRCCTNEAVPELKYTICTKRKGIVPETLRPIVTKRSFYKKEKKRLKKSGDERWHIYDRRQNALKWMLVTCFGYLGYKNARFGKIEAHESVNAFSRDAILTAKEIAEARGYKFLHAIIDCMWLKRDGATEEDYEALCTEVSTKTNIEISLEGIYNWILFPTSKMDPNIPTANRYVGFYTNKEIKVRGIEVRRRDTPKFIKRMQGEMLEILGEAENITDVKMLAPAALAKAKEYVEMLRSGKADPLELVIRRHISQEASEYKNRSANAEVAKALEEAGIKLQPGESIEYILLDSTGKKKPEKAKPLSLYSFDDGYDIEKYVEITFKAVETLLLPLGYDEKTLKQGFGMRIQKRRKPVSTPFLLPQYVE